MALSVASIGTAATGSTSVAAGYPSGIAAGDLLVYGVSNKFPSNGPTTPSGWAQNGQAQGGNGSAGGDSGDTYSTVLTKEAVGSESGSLSVTITGGDTAVGRMLRLTKSSGNPWSLASTTGAQNTVSTTITTTGAADPGVQAGDVVLVFFAPNTDSRTFDTATLTVPGCTVGAATEQFESYNGGGNFCGLVVYSFPIVSGTSSGAPTFTCAASGTGTNSPCGGITFLRVRADPPPPISAGVISGTITNGTTSVSVAYPSGISAGDMLLMLVVSKYSGPAAVSGWGNVSNGSGSGGAGASGADSGNAYTSLYYKTASGSESGSVIVSNAGGNSMQGCMVRYSKASGYSWATPVAANGADNTAGTAFSVTGNVDPGLAADDMLVVLAGTNTDARTYSGQAVTATGCTFGTAVELTDTGTTQGDDCRIVVSEYPVLTGPSSAAPVFTMTASGTTSNQNAGSAIFIRLRASAGPIGTLSSTLDGATVSAAGVAPEVGAAAVTLAAATIASAGVVPVVGTASATLGGATLVGTGTGTTEAIGSLAVTLAGASGASAGTAPAQGAALPALAGATVSAAGAARAAGGLSTTLGGATLASAGQAPVVGGLAATLQGTTGASSGAVPVVGSAAAPLSGATVSATGTGGATAAGALSATLAGATVASAGVTPAVGSATGTLQGASIAASGVAAARGTAAGTLAGASTTATGTARAAGALAASLAVDTVSSSGTAPVRGTAAPALAGVTLAAAGQVGAVSVGQLSATLAGVVTGSAGVVRVAGQSGVGLGPATVTGGGTAPAQGAASAELASMTALASGFARIAGVLAAPIAGAGVVAVGEVPIVGALASTLQGSTAAATGNVEDLDGALGDLAATLAGVSIASAGRTSWASWTVAPSGPRRWTSDGRRWPSSGSRWPSSGRRWRI